MKRSVEDSPPVNKEKNSPETKLASSPPNKYVCAVRNWMSRNRCEEIFYNLGKFKLHLRQMHSLPPNNYEQYYVKQ